MSTFFQQTAQPKTCFWVSVVGGRAFLQRSLSVQRETVLPNLPCACCKVMHRAATAKGWIHVVRFG